MVEHGSFKRGGNSHGSGFDYSVVTPRGKIVWADDISGCTDLVRIMKKASEESTLGLDAKDSGMPS
jgi:hypothetical protein